MKEQGMHSIGMKRISSRLVLLLVPVVVLGATPAFGAHPLISDDAGTQGMGKSQIEWSGQYDRQMEDAAKTGTWTAKGQLTYGLINPLDLGVEGPYLWGRLRESGDTAAVDGMGDVTVGLKWRFFQREGLGFAVKTCLNLPTGDEEKGLGFGREGYGVVLIASRESLPWAFHVNAGYSHKEYGQDAVRNTNRRDLWNVSAACEYVFTEDIKIVGNVGIECSPAVTSNDNPSFLLGGIIYSIGENLDVDMGIKSVLNRWNTDYSVLAGITMRF